MNAFLVMVYRQVLRFWRQQSRFLGSIINPIVWLLFFGLGWNRLFSGPIAGNVFGNTNYISFLIPGLIMMTVFSNGFISGIALIWDKQFGFIKETLVAPVHRGWVISGRIIGDSLVALFQGLIIAIIALPFAKSLNILGILLVIPIAFLLSVAFSSLGITIATKMKSPEGFQIIMNILMLPLIFLSGAMYPVKIMPKWMQILAYLNPLTYAVDSARYFLIYQNSLPIILDIFILSALSILFLYIAILSFNKATI